MPVVPERQIEEPELSFLYDEGRARLNEILTFAEQQESKALAIVRISLIIIAASGIFGDLEITATDPVSILSVLAIAATLGVAAMAIHVFFPAEWETGLDVPWFSKWAHSGAKVEHMRARALEVFNKGYESNLRISRRGRWLRCATKLLVLQVAFVVGVEIVSAL